MAKLNTKYTHIWNTVLVGLEEAYFLGLAKIFEKPNELDETISIYHFLDYRFIKHNKTIDNLKKLRNKMLVHLDAKKMAEKEKFLKELDFKSDRSDIESLFDTTIESVAQLQENFEFNENLKQRFEQEKKDTRNKFDEWFAVFKQGN